MQCFSICSSFTTLVRNEKSHVIISQSPFIYLFGFFRPNKSLFLLFMIFMNSFFIFFLIFLVHKKIFKPVLHVYNHVLSFIYDLSHSFAFEIGELLII